MYASAISIYYFFFFFTFVSYVYIWRVLKTFAHIEHAILVIHKYTEIVTIQYFMNTAIGHLGHRTVILTSIFNFVIKTYTHITLQIYSRNSYFNSLYLSLTLLLSLSTSCTHPISSLFFSSEFYWMEKKRRKFEILINIECIHAVWVCGALVKSFVSSEKFVQG